MCVFACVCVYHYLSYLKQNFFVTRSLLRTKNRIKNNYFLYLILICLINHSMRYEFAVETVIMVLKQYLYFYEIFLKRKFLNIFRTFIFNFFIFSISIKSSSFGRFFHSIFHARSLIYFFYSLELLCIILFHFILFYYSIAFCIKNPILVTFLCEQKTLLLITIT